MAKGVAAVKPQKKISAATQAMLDEMSNDQRKASPDALNKVSEKLRELRGIDQEIGKYEQLLREKKERRQLLLEKEIVDVLDEAGMTSAGIQADGNNPALDVEVRPYYHANIAVDWPEEQRKKSFAWIDKFHPGMLRNTFTIKFGKSSRKLQVQFEKLAKKNKLEFTNEFGVPWNTLTAFVKEQIEEHKRRPPLDLLGATVGRVAVIKKQKEK
jgi:hypothetical protein